MLIFTHSFLKKVYPAICGQ